MLVFFKDSLNKKVVNPTLELDEGKVSTFSKFEFERGLAQKITRL